MSGGVVFAGGTSGRVPPLTTASGSGLAKFSDRIDLSSGAVPPGAWYLGSAATLITPIGNTTIPAYTYVESDGTNVTIGAAGHGTAVGDRKKPIWPWGNVWPVGQPWFPGG